MKNKKGFTLIELLAVVIVLGLLIAVAFPAISKYTNETRSDMYELHEKSMQTAASNMISTCVQGEVDGCVPKDGESRTVYLKELVLQKYEQELKDPAKTDNFCDSNRSYVVITNNDNNMLDLDYQVCLVCSKYQSEVCDVIQPDTLCDKTVDSELPTCGEVVGASSMWTNEDRLLSVGCGDSGCGCTQNAFSKKFTETTKKGSITIVDKAGNYKECEVDVNVDKDKPTCSLEVVGTKGENGWYKGAAPIVKFVGNPMDGDKQSGKDVYSGVATYGIGINGTGYDFNKQTSYTVSEGITTVYGYIKDNAGNIGICSTEVKYDKTVDKATVVYGYQIYPKSDLATVDGQKIKLNSNFFEYGNILGINVYLNNNPSGINVSVSDGTNQVITRTISSGVLEMNLSFSGSYNYLEIDLGSSTNVTRVSKVEVITNHTDGFYTNQDVVVYASSNDGVYYSFNNGPFKTSNKMLFTENGTSYNVRVKDSADNISEATTFKIDNIDKDKPSCTIDVSANDDWYISYDPVVRKVIDLKLNFDDNNKVGDNVISNIRDYGLSTSATPIYNNINDESWNPDGVEEITWYGYVRDKAGNTNVCSKVVKKKTEEKYAIYSETDKSLRFVSSLNEIKVGDTYDGRVVTAVYTGFENKTYSSSTVPWRSYIGIIEKVIVETDLKPVSLKFWFTNMKECSYLDVSKIDTSKVSDMSYLFYYVGYDATSFSIIGLEKWNTSDVINMNFMFSCSGHKATNWSIGDLSDWNTSNVIYMISMFSFSGVWATSWTIGDLGDWDVSSVTTMYNMFYCAGGAATTFNIGDLSNWDVSSVSSMSSMFTNAGNNATTFNIGDLSNWDVSNVTTMSNMFDSAGYKALWSLNLSEWEVDKVTNYENFNKDVESKVIPPVWVN